MKSASHIFLKFTSSTIILGSLILAYFTFLDGTVFNPVAEYNGDYLLETARNVYHPGEVVSGSLNFCKLRDITPSIQWTLIDTYIKSYPEEIRGIGEVRCYKDVQVEIEPVPKDSFPGTYHFAGTVTYHVNGLRDVVVHLRTNNFQVVK